MKSRTQSTNEAASGKIVARAQPGYYPGYSSLSQQDSWDKATRATVAKRVASVPPIRFFDSAEAGLLGAVIDRLVPQDDRIPEKRIPILPVIDERLYKNELIGFRYEDMPPDRDAYHLGLRAIDEMAMQRFKSAFVRLNTFPQELILKSIHDGKPDPAVEIWTRLPVRRFWSLIFEDCVTAYYAHPWTWDEIGFGGPAYPRGYMRLENGLPESWEIDEVRYIWSPPGDSISDLELADRTGTEESSLLEGIR